MATDFARLDAMTDEDIDCSDIPPLEVVLKNSEGIWAAPHSRDVSLSIVPEVYDYFKNTGKGYLNRLNILVNDFLKNYVKEQQAKGSGLALD